jgi:hypothetical protein
MSPAFSLASDFMLTDSGKLGAEIGKYWCLSSCAALPDECDQDYEVDLSMIRGFLASRADN